MVLVDSGGGVGGVCVVEVVVRSVHHESEMLKPSGKFLLGTHDVGGRVETLSKNQVSKNVTEKPRRKKITNNAYYLLWWR